MPRWSRQDKWMMPRWGLQRLVITLSPHSQTFQKVIITWRRTALRCKSVSVVDYSNMILKMRIYIRRRRTLAGAMVEKRLRRPSSSAKFSTTTQTTSQKMRMNMNRTAATLNRWLSRKTCYPAWPTRRSRVTRPVAAKDKSIIKTASWLTQVEVRSKWPKTGWEE